MSDVAPVSAPEATPTAQPEAPQGGFPEKVRLKVDGNEVEVDFEELKRGYSHQQAANKILQEGKAARQQAEQLVELLKNDPLSVLKDPRLGLNVRKLAEEYLAQEIGDELMDPKERELRDLKRWKEQQENERKAAAEAEEQARQEELKGKYIEDYSNSILQVLETGGLPKTPTAVRRIAYYMHEGLKRNMDLSPKDVVGLVREDFINEQRELYGNADGETLLNLLGEPIAAKIRKVDLARLKQSGTITTSGSKAARATREAAPQDKKGISKDEWREMMKQYTRG